MTDEQLDHDELKNGLEQERKIRPEEPIFHVLPATAELLQRRLKSRREAALKKSLDAGSAAQGGDGWHSSTYRILQDEMWVLADLQATTQEQVALSDVLDKPEQFETIEQGHVIRLNLKGDMKSDYDRDYINVHLVSSIDALVLKSILEKDPRFIEDEGGEHFTISVESPFGQALIGKTKGESVQFVGGHGDTYKARVAGEDDAIQLSDLFNIFIAEENT